MSDIKDFKLPDLGEGLEEGEIVAWHVQVGDVVELNQTVADIETAKAVVAVPSPFAGTVVELVGDVGEVLQVGSVFVRIDVGQDGQAAGDAGEDGHADNGVAPSSWDAEEEPQPLVGYGQGKAVGGRRRRRRTQTDQPMDDGDAPPTVDASGTDNAGVGHVDGQSVPVLAKPPVRKLAKDLGVDLASLAPGSGLDGVITRGDVQAAAEMSGGAPATTAEDVPARAAASAPPPAVRSEISRLGFRGRHPGEVEPIRGIRRRIVEKMELSRREIPSASATRDVDVTVMWELAHDLTRQAEDEGFDVKITPFVLLMRATLLGLRRFPTLNARIVGRSEDAPGEIHLLEPIHLGFAADTDRGLVVPNIKDAHTKSVLGLASELTELAAKARDGSITPEELTGGTFTVNNYGAFGNDDGDPILNHPEVGILGIGAMRERPWVVSGELTVRRVATLRLAFDHRACDGGEAGRFVTYVADLCEDPSRILLHT